MFIKLIIILFAMVVGISNGNTIAKIGNKDMHDESKCRTDSDCLGQYLGPNSQN